MKQQQIHSYQEKSYQLILDMHLFLLTQYVIIFFSPNFQILIFVLEPDPWYKASTF